MVVAGRSTDQGELANPMLAVYEMPERRAILVHKYFLGIELACDPGIQAAIYSWERRCARQWRSERQMTDAHEQIVHIDEHRRLLNDKAGEEVSWESAAHDWITNHAAGWRVHRES